MNKLKLLDPSQTLQKPPKLNPKQIQYLEYYYGIEDKQTVGNTYKSAVRAGFKPSYARIMTTNQMNLQWLADVRAYMRRLTPEHIRHNLEDEAINAKESRDRIRANELLGKAMGMFIERTQSEVSVTFTNSVPRPILDITPIDDNNAHR